MAAPFNGASSSRVQARGLPTPRGAWKALAEQMCLAFVSKENPKVGFKKSLGSAAIVALVMLDQIMVRVQFSLWMSSRTEFL